MRAHAPGSVTGLFAPAAEEGGAAGGASFATRDGVVVEVEPAAETGITVEGERAPFEPVERVLAALEVTASVDVRPEVPLGNGFGTSGAATLATALAANERFDLGRDREALLDAAYDAEVAAGTGESDVIIQDRGGLLWNAGDGVRRSEVVADVEYATAGGIATSEMLSDESFVETASRIGFRELERFDEEPTLRSLAERSRAFLRETGIATPFVEREIERVEAAGGAAGMALFGETVFAVDVDRVLPERTTVSNEGARLLPEGE
ncbi:GHMP kinase [Halobacteriales archaeon QS_5_70_15]|nr:MAG: GHMP kinase [Halobacteriales archaeon QS_5_70_15]